MSPIKEKLVKEEATNFIDGILSIVKEIITLFTEYQNFIKLNNKNDLLLLLTGIIYKGENRCSGMIKQGFIPYGAVQDPSIKLQYFTAETMPIRKEIDIIFKKYSELEAIEIRTNLITGELYFTITLNGIEYEYSYGPEALEKLITEATADIIEYKNVGLVVYLSHYYSSPFS